MPFRSGGSLCASKVPDAQAAYESAATLIPTVLAGVNFVLHAAGWLEGGLSVGYEKFVLDADQCGMMGVFTKGVDLSENGQGLDAIRENGPGQHFLGTAHTLANFETRHALYYDQVMNSALERPADYQSESTQRRVAAAGDKLLTYLLFCDECALTAPVSGDGEFRRTFEQRGPRDREGRSLRDLDLTTRLLKYPCSYLIYSEAFDRLPPPVHEYVVGRLHNVLTGADEDPAFAHLSAEDRAAILEILSETKPDLWP